MTPEEYLNSITIDRELELLASCNKHTSRNNNAIYKTYCLDLGEFEKENNMSNSSIIKSCDNCKYADRPGYAWPCTDCLVHNKWEKRNIPQSNKKQNIVIPAIKDVIFNPPATIIIWEDHTKTVVKCGENDIYDPEKGMAMAISRKALGDKGSYYNVFEKWVNPYIEKCEEFKVAHPVQSAIYETLSNMSAKTDELRKIINNMSEKVSSYAYELEPENTDNDNSEEPSDYDLWCCDCKYDTLDDHVSPCIDCVDFDQFEPDKRTE